MSALRIDPAALDPAFPRLRDQAGSKQLRDVVSEGGLRNIERVADHADRQARLASLDQQVEDLQPVGMPKFGKAACGFIERKDTRHRVSSAATLQHMRAAGGVYRRGRNLTLRQRDRHLGINNSVDELALDSDVVKQVIIQRCKRARQMAAPALLPDASQNGGEGVVHLILDG
jgi:hypothetical protein